MMRFLYKFVHQLALSSYEIHSVLNRDLDENSHKISFFSIFSLS